MCQYVHRCKVKKHWPTTVCPYTHRGGGRTSPSQSAVASSRPTTAHLAGSSERQQNKRVAQAGAGGSSFDLLLWVFIVLHWDGEVTLRAVIIAISFVGVPFAIGWWLLRECGAWINDGTRRCRRIRQGFLRRCFDHREQALTARDLAGALSLGIGCLNALILVAALLNIDVIT